jgi:hypothetical protein
MRTGKQIQADIASEYEAARARLADNRDYQMYCELAADHILTEERRTYYGNYAALMVEQEFDMVAVVRKGRRVNTSTPTYDRLPGRGHRRSLRAPARHPGPALVHGGRQPRHHRGRRR